VASTTTPDPNQIGPGDINDLASDLPPGFEPAVSPGESENTVTYRDVLKEEPVKILAISRFAVKMAVATITYGAMVYLATEGASQFQISLANSASFLAALLFGAQGGMIADTVSKRRILYLSFAFQAALCFLIPIFTGTGLASLLMLIFVSSALGRVTGPGLTAAVAVVATPAQMATTGALVSVVGSIGSAIGSAFLAPILIKYSSINAVLAVGGVLFLIGAVRIRNLPAETIGSKSIREGLRGIDWAPRQLSLKVNAQWMVDHGAVGSMLLARALVVALFNGVQSLLPLYTLDVLNEDPANMIYIFAPAGIGYLIGAVGGPRLISWLGERKLLIVSVGFLFAGTMLLGMINTVAPLFAPLNPLRLLEPLFDIQLSEVVLAAGVIAIPLNIGSTAAGLSVQIFINKNVNPIQQGRIFGMQSVQNNALSLITVMLLGIVATLTNIQFVLFAGPIIIGGLVLWLVRYSFKHIGRDRMTLRQELHYLGSDPEGSAT
jgi:MFS family permease